MRELGANFVLDEASNGAFYRNLIRDNVASGYAVLSALTAGDEVVAILLGVRTGTRYVMCGSATPAKNGRIARRGG